MADARVPNTRYNYYLALYYRHRLPLRMSLGWYFERTNKKYRWHAWHVKLSSWVIESRVTSRIRRLWLQKSNWFLIYPQTSESSKASSLNNAHCAIFHYFAKKFKHASPLSWSHFKYPFFIFQLTWYSSSWTKRRGWFGATWRECVSVGQFTHASATLIMHITPSFIWADTKLKMFKSIAARQTWL